MSTATNLPSRLHHTAYVSKDLEATRHFYEDLLGLPLIATWCEKDHVFGKERTYCHTFFGIGDGGALAFFQFADPDDEREFVPDIPKTPFVHLALKTDSDSQRAIWKRLQEAGYREPQIFELDHGYCRSIYMTDPNGMLVEFTVDPANVDEITRTKRADAHSELARWLAGDRRSNNTFAHR
ncbi:MAG: VOC family protein [Gammaproteobacteria bacterium]